MLKTYKKKNPRKTAAIWIICGEKKRNPPKIHQGRHYRFPYQISQCVI